MELTESQKNFLSENADKIKNLIDLTKACFEDDSLDGRSKEGRAVRKYLVENSINFKTTATSRTEDIILNRSAKRIYFTTSRRRHVFS